MAKKQTWFKRANPDPDIAKNVAGQAKRGSPNRKALSKLEIRVADWKRIYAQSKAPPQGAYHCPGSLQFQQ